MKPIQRRSAISWLLSSVTIVLCAGTFMYQAGLQVERYLDYSHQSVPTEVKRKSLVFPSVTVCTNSWINKQSEACLKTPRLCTKFGQEVHWGIFRAQFEPEMRTLVGYEPREIFECRMESTSSECQSFNCVDHIRTTFLRLPIMLCYTLDSKLYGGPDNLLEKCGTPWLYELRIRLRFIEKNTLRLIPSLPLPVFVQQPQLCRPERNAAIALVAQKSYDITIKQQKKRRLPAPFSSRCKDYNSEGVKQEFYGIASKEVMRGTFPFYSNMTLLEAAKKCA
ncbi:uncharacterized protein LOC119394594 [Rhipicephalus sanguineus]|uniref:uncharacterized protein LOC119394594 n=1 Tax=Rhipicephalus sanguineus TaxID=34632 RepID=UPI0020C42E78|nr:uncharacterized protein LOC119394594 [Rhipicephalus sanguineus]